MAEAKREGTVNVYGAGSQNKEALADPFERAYPGIKVNLTLAPPADVLSRITSERTAEKYIGDVLTSLGASAIVPLKPIGALVPLEQALILPEVTDLSVWLNRKLWWLDEAEPHTTLAYVGDVNAPAMYNTKLIDPKQFTSYLDLLDPKWKGKMSATDVRRPGGGAVITRFWYTQPGLGPQFMERLFRDMSLTLSSDPRQMIDWVAQGRYPIGLMPNYADVFPAVQQGLPLGLLSSESFKEGVPIGPSGGTVSLLDKGPHPNAARVFLNWLLSKDGQLSWQKNKGDNSLRTDISKEGVPPSYLPDPKSTYVNAGTEGYAKLSSTVIPDVVNKALQEAKP